MRKSIAAALIAAAAATSACGQDRSENGGPTVAKNYKVGSFDQIEVGGPVQRRRPHRRQSSVSARGPQKMLEHMVVEVKGGKLVIHPDRQKGLFHSGWHYRGTVDVTVTVPMLRGAAIAGSGDIKVNAVKGEAFDGSVAGSGGLDVGIARRPDAQAGGRRIGRDQVGTGRAQERFVRHRRLGRHRRQGRPGADRRRLDRRVGQCRRQRHRHRLGQHHGIGRRRRDRRRQMLGQQGRIGQRQLLLKRPLTML